MKTIIGSKDLEDIVLQCMTCDVNDVIQIDNEGSRFELKAIKHGSVSEPDIVDGFDISIIDDTGKEIYIDFRSINEFSSVELLPKVISFYTLYAVSLKYI